MDSIGSSQAGPEREIGFNPVSAGNVRVLILEDNPFDSELMERELKENGIDFEARRVDSEQPYRRALQEFCPDLILSDYDLPQLNGSQALNIARDSCPDVPFILVTDAVGEDRAIEVVTRGASDYVLKSQITRLAPAVRRALQKSHEHRKRRSAGSENNALDPAGEIGTLALADIIDRAAVQSLLEDFYKFARVPIVIEDLAGNILVSVGWQEICAKFHRVHPETCRHCVESDTRLSSGIRPGEFRLYKCKNNMWDMATPIVIGGQHVGNFYTGQFVFDDEARDYERFRSQARQYGFDEEAYLAAYAAVPVLSREFVDTVMRFLMKLADMISKLSFSNVKLSRTLTKFDAAMKKLNRSREELNRAQSVAKTGSWRLDIQNNNLYWSEETYRIFGIPINAPVTYDMFLAAIHPDDREAVHRKWKEAQEKGSYDLEHRIIVGSEVKWIRERAEFDLDAEGGIVRGFGTAQDITDLKRTEEAQKESEAQFRAIFDLTGIGMGLLDSAGNIVNVNDTFLKMVGFEKGELIGLPLIDFAHPEDAASKREEFLRLLRGEIDIFETEKRLIRKDGTFIWCLSVDVLIRDPSGKPLRVVFAFHDITERKRTETILRENEERFRLAQQAGKVGVFDWALDKDECIVSEELAKIYGFPPGHRPNGGEWIHFVHPDDRRSAYARVQQAFKKQRDEVQDEYRIVSKEGRIIWLSSHSRIYYESGKPVRMIGTSVDVTERKQAEIALRHAEEKLRLAVESTELGTFDMDPRTYRLDWSANSKLQFGIPPDAEVDYETFLRGIHPDDRERISSLVQQLFRGEAGGYYSAEFRTIGIRDGKLRWLAAWGRVFFNEEGRAVRFIGVTADITELKRTEQSLKKRTVELENLNRELESFSYSVSHDLRAPLRAIKGYSDMILRQHGPFMQGDVRDKFGLILENAGKMEELIKDLLRLSRLGRGRLALSDLDLKALALEAWGEIMQLSSKKIELRIHDLPRASGDRNLLKQVMVNLLSNALKFTRPRPQPMIEFGGYRKGEENVYFVRDNGVGFDMQYYSRLFGVFQRLHGAEYEGTGVGLAIVQRIIRRHGGRVWAESEVNRGATFYFSLPCPKVI